MAGNAGYGGMTNTGSVLGGKTPKPKVRGAKGKTAAKPRGTAAARAQYNRNKRTQKKIDRGFML